MFDHRTPLHYACKSGRLEIAKLLVEHKADITLRTAEANVYDEHDGMTAIHFAASSGNVKLVKFLVSKGAKVNEKTADGISLFI